MNDKTSDHFSALDPRAVKPLPAARRIVHAWRRLTGGEPTLLACSAGADSTALILALAAAEPDSLAIAHIIHDIRPPDVTRREAEHVESLARRLALPFDSRSISIPPGNTEARARRLRYEALAGIARARGIAFVATAHHADDQLETLVMALIRGAGPDGMRAIAESRRLDDAVALVRPMLHTTRAEARELCEAAGAHWHEDETNADTTRLRAALRHGPVADITALRPSAPRRAARTAELMRDAAHLVADRAREVFADNHAWPREALRAERPIVIGAGLRRAALTLTGGARADRLTSSRLDPVVRAIRDDSTEPRTFHWPGGLVVTVTAREVSIHRERTKKAPPE